MASYKAEVTLNEKDSLQDLLNAEKSAVKIYATALTEGASKGYRNTLSDLIVKAEKDQLSVFLLMTDHDYCRVQSASEQRRNLERQKFSAISRTLS